MKRLILLTAILFTLLACTPTPESPIQIVQWYLQEGHRVLHAKASEDYTSADLETLIHNAINTVENRLEPNHGLYIVVEGDDKCLYILGFTYDAVQSGGDPQVLTYDDFHIFGIQGIWPTDRIPVKTIVCNYAWLLGAHYNEIHPWFSELANGRPLPLDSGFMWGR